MRLFFCWRLCCPTCFFFCQNDSRTDFFFLRASATGCNSYFCSNAFRTSDFLRMRLLLFLCWRLSCQTCFYFCCNDSRTDFFFWRASETGFFCWRAFETVCKSEQGHVGSILGLVITRFSEKLHFQSTDSPEAAAVISPS